MNPDPHIPDHLDDETLSREWIAALRALPSEQVMPSSAKDAAILSEARTSLSAIRRRKIILRFWPIFGAAACLAIAFIFLLQYDPKSKPEMAAATPEDKYAVILREVSALFPHQIKAIMTDGGELQIALSDEPVAEDAQAVVIEACGNGGCSVVITYIGQTVEFGRQHVTVQADENGVIIIKGQKKAAPDLQIKSRSI